MRVWFDVCRKATLPLVSHRWTTHPSCSTTTMSTWMRMSSSGALKSTATSWLIWAQWLNRSPLPRVSHIKWPPCSNQKVVVDMWLILAEKAKVVDVWVYISIYSRVWRIMLGRSTGLKAWNANLVVCRKKASKHILMRHDRCIQKPESSLIGQLFVSYIHKWLLGFFVF